MHAVDVGQGDAVVWELPGGGLAVYDCGPPASSSASNKVAATLRTLGLEPGGTLHTLVASHGHLDHVGGCVELLQDYRVLHLYEAWYDGTDAPQSYARFRDQVKKEGGVVHTLGSTSALEGEVPFKIGDLLELPAAARAANVRAEIIWPPPSDRSGWRNIADTSIAIRLSLGTVDFCFQGDIDAAEEASLTERFAGKDCEYYLVGHHGSRYASTKAWLAAMDPEVAVVSFGSNSHGHPTSDALCRVQQAGAKVYATNRLGNVVVETDGLNATVLPDRAETLDYCRAGVTYWGTSTPAATADDDEPAPVPTPTPSPLPPPAPSPTPSASGVVISSVDPSPVDGPATSEWIQLANQGTVPVDLTGWTLQDDASTPHKFIFPAGFTLHPGAAVKVVTGTGTNTSAKLYWGRGDAVWNNDHDVAKLFDAAGALVHSRSW